MNAKISAVFVLLVLALTPLAFAEGKGLAEKEQVRNKGLNEKVAEARALVAQARELRQATHEQLVTRVQELRQVREQLSACKSKETEDCVQLRVQAKARIKDALIKADEHALKMLEEAKARVIASGLGEQAKQEILAELEARIAKIIEVRSAVEALSEQSTSKETKDAIKQVKSAVLEAKRTLRASVHELVAEKLGGVLVKAAHLEARLEKALERLEKAGENVSGIDLSGFKAKISEARRLHGEGVALFERFQTEKNPELVKQATERLRESHNALKDAHALLRDLVFKIKVVNGGAQAIEAQAERPNIKS